MTELCPEEAKTEAETSNARGSQFPLRGESLNAPQKLLELGGTCLHLRLQGAGHRW